MQQRHLLLNCRENGAHGVPVSPFLSGTGIPPPGRPPPVNVLRRPGTVSGGAADHRPAQGLRNLPGILLAAAEIGSVLLVNIGLGAGLPLPPPQETVRRLGGHVQIQHQIRFRKPQTAVFQIKEPVQKGPPLPAGELGGLVDRVGGGVAVGNHHAAGLVEPAPVLLIRGKAVHGKHGGRGIGVDVAGLVPQSPPEITRHRLGKGIAVPGKINLPAGQALPPQMLQQELGLGGLAGAVRPLQYNQCSFHLRRFSRCTWTRNRGSFIIRPARRGSLHRR